MSEDRIFSTELDPQEEALRPEVLSEYVGQSEVRENLKVMIESAQKRGKQLDHLLFYGPPGLGKTTLAYIIAREMGANLRTTSGPVIERQGDLAALLTNLQPGDVLFIDEIHRLPKAVEEILYPAMEDYRFDIIIGKGPAAQSVPMTLPPFTLVGATTRIGLLSSPLQSRFGWPFRLEFYDEQELYRIIVRAAGISGHPIDDGGAREIARRSRGTPRIALRLLNRVRDFAQVGDGLIDQKTAQMGLDKLGVDNAGLDGMDQAYVLSLIDKFRGGPVGLETLAAALAEEKDTLENTIEPFLLQRGYIDRTPRGRIATENAYRHFNRTRPVAQGGLFS